MRNRLFWGSLIIGLLVASAGVIVGVQHVGRRADVQLCPDCGRVLERIDGPWAIEWGGRWRTKEEISLGEPCERCRARWQIHSPLVIVDSQTTLRWTIAPVSSHGETFADAAERCAELDLNGISNWRLPSPDDFKGIEARNGFPSLFERRSDCFWADQIQMRNGRRSSLSVESAISYGLYGANANDVEAAQRMFLRDLVRPARVPQASFICPLYGSKVRYTENIVVEVPVESWDSPGDLHHVRCVSNP